MEEVNLFEELRKGIYHFEHKIIRCPVDGRKIIIRNNIQYLYFDNCTFEDNTYLYSLDNEQKLELNFSSCSFKNKFSINIFKIEKIQFDNIIIADSIDIIGPRGQVKQIYFEYTKLQNCNINISLFSVEEINILDFNIEGGFSVNLKNTLSEKPTHLNLIGSVFNKLRISNCYIPETNSFYNILINGVLQFYNCKFDSIRFDNSKIKYGLTFNECEFTSLMSYKDRGESCETNLLITNCTFKKSSYFDNSVFQSINIRDTTFEEKVSFDSVKTNAVNLSQIIFLGNAYFDNFKILNPFNNTFSIIEKKRTYRTIKQELQKLENRIDYNIFRVYELTMHKLEVKELLQNSKISDIERSSLLKDKCILFLHQYASNFGTDWKKALTFVLCSGFTFYTILFIVENSNKEIDIYGFHNYIKGFFNFIMVTNFDNPLENKDVLKFNYIPSYFIFILGKIFIAFGIYEMIQSFRKFRY